MKSQLIFESTPCMIKSLGRTAPRNYVLFTVKGSGNTPVWGLRAIVKRDQLPGGPTGKDFDATFRNDQVLGGGWVHCAQMLKSLRTPIDVEYGKQNWDASHAFQSNQGYDGCVDKGVDPYSPQCGTTVPTGAGFFWNYEYPRRTGFPFTELVTSSHTTTGICGGGIARAVFEVPAGGLGSATDVNSSGVQNKLQKRDYVDYVDHAVPCTYKAVAQWEHTSYRGVWGWMPRHVEDGYVRDHTTTHNCPAPE